MANKRLRTRASTGLLTAGLTMAAFGAGCNNAAEGAFSGAGIGALAGFGLGSLTGNAGSGAAAGAITGAVSGMVIGDQNERRGSRIDY